VEIERGTGMILCRFVWPAFLREGLLAYTSEREVSDEHSEMLSGCQLFCMIGFVKGFGKRIYSLKYVALWSIWCK